ncbi:MAG: DNA-3-methyladenine glycosylase 2 family protein [Actinomycetota bacterium]
MAAVTLTESPAAPELTSNAGRGAADVDEHVDEHTSDGTGAPLTAASIRSALAPFRHGVGDPTTRLVTTDSSGDFVRATSTPDGPATVRVRWSAPSPSAEASVDADAWGPGGDWLIDRVDAMTGTLDPGARQLESADHPVVAHAARAGRHLRFGASHDLYHELLPTIIEQRITSGEAVRQWARLCRTLGRPAPGPWPDLVLPPAASDLARTPTWWFHPLGIERKRASALVEVARHAPKYWDWAGRGPGETARLLGLLRGVGVWTIGSVLGPALGDPDALCVGDYHAKNVVAWALDREPRGTDDEMLDRLAPFAGQRGRVLRMLGAAGYRPPAFGPRQRILPMHRW